MNISRRPVNLEEAELRPRGGGETLHEADIRTFISRDYVRVVRAVAAVCGDRERAEDAVQDAVVDVWSKRREVDDLAGWVATAALNRARSRWRSAAAAHRAFERLAQRTMQAAATPITSSSLDVRVAQALGGLPRSQRTVVALHYLLDMSVVEIASRLGVAEGTVKTHLHRGRNALRVALSGPADDEEVDRGER